MMHLLRLLILHPMLWVVIRMIREMIAEMRMKMTTTLMKTLRRKKILVIVELSTTNTPLRRRMASSVFFFVRYCSTWGTP
jgi:hypothetical protein